MLGTTQSKNYISDLLIVKLLDIKINKSITLLLIFNHLSHVQLCLVL